jgi:signal transduction histidine kinase
MPLAVDTRPSGRERAPSIESLLWALGFFCAFCGAFVLIAPHHFRTTPYEALRLYAPWWGGLALIAGVTLLGTAILRPPRRFAFAALGLATLALVSLGVSFALTSSWTGANAYLTLGLGALAAAFLPRRDPTVPEQEGDLFALLMGVIATINGAILLAGGLASPGLAPSRAYIPALGMAFLVTGPPLCLAQLLPRMRPGLRWLIHLLAGLAFVTYGTLVAIPSRFWTGIALYVCCGGALAVLPWLRRQVSTLDSLSLRTRLAFSLATAVSVALILTAAVATYQEEALAERQVIDARKIEAAAAAQNVADYVALSGARTSVVAASAGRALFTPEQQQELLDSTLASASASSGITAFATFDPAGNLVAAAGKLPPDAEPALRSLAVRRLRRPELRIEATLPRAIEPPLLLMSVPVVASDGSVPGLVVALVEASSLAGRISRPRSNIYLADGHGQLITSWETRPLAALPPGWDQDLDRGNPLPEGERLAAFAPVPGMEWAVAVERSRDDALAGVHRGRDLAFGLLILLIPLAVVGGKVVARRIAQPLHTLSEAVGGLTGGNLAAPPAAPLEISGITEVDRLSAAFGEMRDRLALRTQELRARNEALTDSDRRKDEFLAMLAHELRNPLGAIANASYLLEQVGPGNPQWERSVAIIRRQIQHLVRMVDDLLDVSRITQGKVELRRERADLREIVHHAVDTARPLIEAKRHQIAVVLPPEPVPLEADVTRLEQVLSNLLRNAAKYTEEGGRIEVILGRADGEALLCVCDNGIGMAPELLSRVFDLFTQGEQSLDRAGAGLGIGLTLVRSLVEMHGGRVEARSDGPGCGSELVVWLPLAEPARSESQDDPAALPSPQRSFLRSSSATRAGIGR